MPLLIKQGFVYIAQPPLYQIARKKRVEYVVDDPQLNRILIQLGTEDVRLRNLADHKETAQKPLAEILELLESLDNHIAVQRVELHEKRTAASLDRTDQGRTATAEQVQHFFCETSTDGGRPTDSRVCLTMITLSASTTIASSRTPERRRTASTAASLTRVAAGLTRSMGQSSTFMAAANLRIHAGQQGAEPEWLIVFRPTNQQDAENGGRVRHEALCIHCMRF
jgi:hypothetical protein